jgi:F-type H+-transporting ATPase subunit a
MTFAAPLFFADAAASAPPGEGITPKPVNLFSVDGFEINNSMVSEIIATCVIIAVVQVAMRSPKLIPSGLQNFVEWLVESMNNFLGLLLDRPTLQRSFWYFAGLFVFIVSGNLLALIPGVGTFGWGHEINGHFEVTQPFLRGANANDNLTGAYSAIFFVMFFYWAIRGAGVGGSLMHIFGPKVRFANKYADLTFITIFFLVGWIEVVSILFVRPIAFTFRLFGNIYGGEFLLDTIYKMAPNFSFILLVPFYFYELLVAVVQAFVFFVLTAAFTGLIANSPDHSTEPEKAH